MTVIKMCEEDYCGDEQAAAEEAAYQEMCEAGAYEEQMIKEAEGEAEAIKAELEAAIESQRKVVQNEELRQIHEALEHGTVNKDPNSKYTPDELRNTNMFKQGVLGKDKVSKP